jgi:hypothetical protein
MHAPAPCRSRAAGQWLRACVRGAAACLWVGLLGGCAALLPSSRNEVVSAWNSYDDAVQTLAALEPLRATRRDVHVQGLDPHHDPSITVLHFGELLLRFAAATLVQPDDVDPGLVRCLQAGQRCQGYAVSVRKLTRQRVGNFWLDMLDFKRETRTTGWGVEVLLVFVDDLLVYELIGGQPTIREDEVRRNPLGPLQGLGEQAVPKLR